MQKSLDQLQLFNQTNFQKSTSSLLDFLAKICQLLESEEDLKRTEAVYSLKQLKSYNIKNPNILSLKMSKVFSQVTEEKTSTSYCEQSPTLGMMVNGNYVILGGTCPKTESEYTLLDILEENPDQKYFLSEKMTKKLKMMEKEKNSTK